MPVKNISLIILLLAVAALLPAALQWDNPVALRQGVNIEWFRTGTESGDGGAVYVWSDTKLGERDLWAQKVDASGNMVWGQPLLVDGKPDRQEDPVITRTSDGNYIIAWIDFSDDLDGNVYAQKISESGQLLWPDGGKPVCAIPSMQLGLNMEADENGGAFVVWGDSRNPSKDLYAQRLSASGDPLWTVNGIPVANGAGDEVQNTMLPDGQGGMIIGYTHTYVGEADVYAKRFDGNGNMTWTAPLELAVTNGNQSGVRMAALTGGDFMFTWVDNRDNEPDIYAQLVNISGTTLWSDPYIVYGDAGSATPAQQLNPRIQGTSDNGAVIVWEDFRLDSQNADLFAQKVSAAGNKLWGDAGIAVATAEFAQIGQRMASDGNGGVYIVWDDLRNGNSPNDDIYAQHLNSNGEALWTAGGKSICSMPFEQNGGLIKVSGDDIFVNWMDLRNGSVGIYYQVLNAAGVTQLADNGVQVFWGLSGDTPKGEYQILPRSNDLLIIWQDTRFANDGNRIFYQIVDTNGNPMFAEDGIPVTLQGGGKQESAKAVVTPDDQFAIVWVDGRDGNPNIYAQLFNPAGERLWGDNGVKLTDDEPLSQSDPKISYFNDSFYIGWSNWDEYNGNYFYHVYGQRIQNGNKLWGDNGVMVSSLESTQMNNECRLYSLIDDMYVWHRVHPSGAQTIWAKRMSPEGTTATGWEEAGLQTSDMGSNIVQLLPLAEATPQGLFVMWKDMRGDYVFNYYGQHISRDGERLWDDAGVNLADRGSEQELPAIATTGTGIVFAWCENVNGMHDIAAQKYSFPGEPLWGDLGYFIVQKDSTQSNPTLVAFDGNGMAVAWTEYMAIESDIYYDYINADGELVFGSGGAIVTNASKAQYEPLSALLDDYVYLVWADGVSSGKTEILGLYMQKLNNETVANDDPSQSPALGLSLKQNYPNPFNPHTNIALDMPKAGELSLNIYNARGQLVKQLHHGELPQGQHLFNWNGTDSNNRSVASGVYFYTAQSSEGTVSRKMLLMK